MDIDEEQLQDEPPMDDRRDYSEGFRNDSGAQPSIRGRDSPVKSSVSQNSVTSQKKSYVRSVYSHAEEIETGVYASISSNALRLAFKITAGVTAGCYIVAAFILAVNPLNKSYYGIIFYISMVIMLACVISLYFEREEVNFAINGIMSFMSNEILLCVYLAANLFMSDWTFYTAVDKASSSFLLISALGVLALISLRVVAIFY